MTNVQYKPSVDLKTWAVIDFRVSRAMLGSVTFDTRGSHKLHGHQFYPGFHPAKQFVGEVGMAVSRTVSPSPINHYNVFLDVTEVALVL